MIGPLFLVLIALQPSFASGRSAAGLTATDSGSIANQTASSSKSGTPGEASVGLLRQLPASSAIGSISGAGTAVWSSPLPSFTLVASASEVTLQPGRSNAGSPLQLVITNPVGLASTKATFTAVGVPAGVTTSFAAINSKTNSLTLKIGSNVPGGTSRITVTATCGSAKASATITLTITVPTFTLAPSASTLSYVVGSPAVSSVIQVKALYGFADNVSFSATGIPSGMTATFSSSRSITQTTFGIGASGPVLAGTYYITITGISGTLVRTARIQLVVTGSPVTAVSIAEPEFGFNLLPGSVRRLYASVTGGASKEVRWIVKGGGTLSATEGHWVDVTAPASGGHCVINGSTAPVVSSASQFTVTAQSKENPSRTASIVLNVCAPAVQVHVVPFYTTLYAGQHADVQAFVWGSVDRNVSWSISAQPVSGNGILHDDENEDVDFSATVPGRYVLTATSTADPTKSQTATIYVTGHKMPYAVTPSGTLPIDCSVDPELAGPTYNVGPSKTYRTIAAVPWTSLVPGSTVRIFNEDKTGKSPTTYHEYFQLNVHASRAQPVRVCGVADSQGNLPVIDAATSSGRSDVSVYSAGYAAVGIGKTGWAGVYTGGWTGAQYLIVEGLKIENARQANTYSSPSGVAGQNWIRGAACVRIFPSTDTVVRGIDVFNCGNGLFSDFNSNNGFALVQNTLYEGNHVHANGEAGSSLDHQFYIQGWNEVVQFNVVDQYTPGASGSNFKSRGFPDVIRYNHFGDGAARQMDLVDNQDGPAYSTFAGYLGNGSKSYRLIYPKDTYTADLLAAAVEAHHSDAIYGNTFLNTSAAAIVHYNADMGTPDNNRLGTLLFFNNSIYEPMTKQSRWYLFDTSGGGGGDTPQVEWPIIQANNNAIWMDSPSAPVFYWNREVNQFTDFGVNAINRDWGSGDLGGGPGTGWSALLSKYAFEGASNQADSTGISDLLEFSTPMFNLSTFAPEQALGGGGQEMLEGMRRLPVRFQYGPAARVKVRVAPRTLGAME